MIKKFYQSWRLFSDSLTRVGDRDFVAISCKSYKDFISGKCCQQVNTIAEDFKKIIDIAENK